MSSSSSTNSLKRKATELPTSGDAKKAKANSSITSFFGQPKVTTSSATADAPAAKKFDKAEWLSSLTQEQTELLQLEIDTLHDSWLSYLADEIKSKEFLELKRFLKKEAESGVKIFPPFEDVYSWSVSRMPLFV